MSDTAPTKEPTDEAPPAEERPYRPGEEVVLRGVPACWNYTFGPAFLYEGPRSIDAIKRSGEPVVVVSDEIPLDELRKIDRTRVRGFILEKGSTIDEELYNFMQTEKRAAVFRAVGATYFAREGGWVIVDGVTGYVCFNPQPQTLAKFQKVRAKGPPKLSNTDSTLLSLSHMITDAVQKKIEIESAGGHFGDAHHDMTKAEIIKADKEKPGLILQLLSGLPIKGVPTETGEPYDPDKAKAAEDGEDTTDEAPAEPKRLTAAERRAARQQEEERSRRPEPAPSESDAEAEPVEAHS